MVKKVKSFLLFNVLLGLLAFTLALSSVAQAQLMDSAWPKFHQNNENTGQSPYPSYSNGTLKWIYDTPSLFETSPAIGSDGVIYIVGDDGILYAINPEGTLKWNYNTGGLGVFEYSPAIDSNGIIYVGDNIGILYAVNPDGSLKWSYTTQGRIKSPVAIGTDNTIYFSTESENGFGGKLYALNPDGSLKWNFDDGQDGKGLAVYNNMIYVSMSPGVCAVDYQTNTAFGCDNLTIVYSNGTLKQRNNIYSNGTFRIGYFASLESSPTIDSDETIYITGEDGFGGKLYALNPDGSLKWNYSIGGSGSTPSISSDKTILITAGGCLYAINPDGTLKWRNCGIETWESESPAIDSNGVIYVAGENGIVYAYNPDGILKWSYNTGEANLQSSPAIGSDGVIYIGGDSGNLYAFNSQAPAQLSGFRFVQLTDVHIGLDLVACGFDANIATNNPFQKWVITEIQKYGCQKSRAESIDKFENVVRNIINLPTKPDFVLITGDVVQWNSAKQYQDFKPFISKFKTNGIDVYIVPGNHDRRGIEKPELLLDAFFPTNSGLINYLGAVDGSDYSNKSFDHKDYRFIGLDSGYDASLSLDPMGSGLSPDQINFTRDNIIDGKTVIFMHHPAIDDTCLFISCNVINENRDEFINLMYDKNVKLVLTGHTHKSKFFNKYGNIFSNPYGSYYRYGTVSNDSITSTYKIVRSPLFVQTRSATDDSGDTIHGYLSIDIGRSLFGQINIADVKMTGKTITPVRYLYLYSPADLHVYDEFGRHTGLSATGNIENNIPDSYYFEEYKLGNITLPAFALVYNTTLNYSYEIVSNFSRENITSDQSVFNFTIENKAENSTTTINYNNVSINRDSKAYLQINNTQTNYTMQLDLNNDSVIDTTKQPDAIETDYAPIAIILSPADGSIWDQGQPVTFNSNGIDREDGTLSKLTWVSDRDDVIGHGNFTIANLSAGVHNITLLVNDSVAQVNTSNMVITVRDTQPPVLNIEYPPENKIFNKQNITVRGFAYDDSGILNVTVNGLEAGKENWDVILSLNEGWNIINIKATDNKGFSTIANRTVYYNSSLASDTEPPAAITNLTHKTGYDSVNRAWINWTWDNPRDADFSYVIICLDNIRMENTSRSYFNITGLSSDADYGITIQSADLVDNINLTEIKDTARTAPTIRTSPEVAISFNVTSKDFRVYNGDTKDEANYVVLPSKDEDSKKGWELRLYTLKDRANNSLVLGLKHKKEGKEAEVKIVSMQYNDGAIIAAPKNNIQAEYSDKKGMLKELEQKIEVQKLFDADAKYSANTDKTEIKMDIEGQKQQKEPRAGIVILELLTDKGGLKLRY